MNKRLTAVLLCCVLLAVTACGGKEKEKESSEEKEQAAEAVTTEVQAVEKYKPAVHEEGKYYVGIVQQADHEALNKVYEGFRDQLSDLMGDEVEIDYQVSDGTKEKSDVIIDHFLQDKDDLIMAAGTNALRCAVAATTDVPIVVTAVTDYIIAGGVSSVGEPGGNVTGVSDLPPMVTQRDLLVQLNSDGGQIGILYSGEEANSEFQCRLMEKYLDEDGHEWKEYVFAGSEDMEEVIKKACSESSVLYLPTDNVLAVNMETVNKYAVENGTRVFTSDGGMCKKGGLVSYGVDYYEIGVEAANMAHEILVYGNMEYDEDDEEADEDRGDPAKIAIERLSETASAWYNPVVAEAIGWTPTDTYSELDVERPGAEETDASEANTGTE